MATLNMPGKYEFLDHAAEVKFRAFGVTRDEAFAHAGLALVQTMCDPTCLQEVVQRTVTLRASRVETLLYDFLSAVLVGIDADGFIPATFRVTITEENGAFLLEAVLFGQETKDVQFDIEVKSITYHQMAVEQTSEGCFLTVVVDV